MYLPRRREGGTASHCKPGRAFAPDLAERASWDDAAAHETEISTHSSEGGYRDIRHVSTKGPANHRREPIRCTFSRRLNETRPLHPGSRMIGIVRRWGKAHCLEAYDIPKRFAAEALFDLHLMNVTPATLFPDLNEAAAQANFDFHGAQSFSSLLQHQGQPFGAGSATAAQQGVAPLDDRSPTAPDRR